MASNAVAIDDRRKHQRIPGPFDGYRIGALETPVRLYDLSCGGCFIVAMHEQRPGVELTLRIDLPYVGPITVKAETLDRRDQYGFAVRFVGVSESAAARLTRALELLDQRKPSVP